MYRQLRPSSRQKQLFMLFSPPRISPLTSCRGVCVCVCVPENYNTSGLHGSVGLRKQTCHRDAMPYSSPSLVLLEHSGGFHLDKSVAPCEENETGLIIRCTMYDVHN